MAINDLLKGMKLTLAAAVVATGMSGCRTPNRVADVGENLAGGTSRSQQYALSGASRGSDESESDYQRRMEELRARQSGMTWTSGGYVPNEDVSRYSGVSQRDVRRYDDDYRHGNGWTPK